MKKVLAFAKKNPVYIASIHALGGIGIGILIARPIASTHPIRWAAGFIILSLLGHLYILVA